MIISGHSFRLLSLKDIKPDRPETAAAPKIKIDSAESDSKKRSFLKLAGVVGVGALATTLLPRKADALVFGSSPTSGVIGVKNASNARINPAQEDGNLATIATQSNFLTFDAGSSPANLKVNIAAVAPGGIDVGLQNASNVTINPATEDSLVVVKTQLNKLTFDGSNNLLTAAAGGAASAVGLKDTTNTQVNPATDDSNVYLRRIVKLMESQAVVDSATRQRITVDSIPAGVTLPTVTTVGTVSTITGGTITTITNAVPVGNIATIAGQGEQMYQDVARNAFANGIRPNLVFS